MPVFDHSTGKPTTAISHGAMASETRLSGFTGAALHHLAELPLVDYRELDNDTRLI